MTCTDSIKIFDYENTLLIRATFYDTANVLVNPTSVEISVLRPDGTTVDVFTDASPEMTHPSTGYYVLEYDTNGHGVYYYRVEGVYEDDIIAYECHFEMRKSKIPVPTP